MVKLPFKHGFYNALMSGRKTATSRTRRFGAPGDRFEYQRHTFELTDVSKVKLGIVAATYYQEEGFNDPDGFIECWKTIHPHKGYDPEQVVWLHRFRRIN